MQRTIEQQGHPIGRDMAVPAQGSGSRRMAAGVAAALSLAVPVCLAQVVAGATGAGNAGDSGPFAVAWGKLAPLLAYGLQSALVLMAFVLGLLIWQRRAQRHIGWLLALMPGWIVMVGLAPLTPWPAAIAVVLAPWLLWCAVHYLMRRLRRRDRRLHRLLMAQALLFPAALLLPVPSARVAAFALWWLGAQLLVAMAWHLWNLWQDMFLPTLEERYPSADFVVSCALVGFGALAILCAWALPGSGLAGILAPLSLIGLGLHRVREFARALTQSELAVLQGELRLQERIAELERHFDQVAEAKLEQVTERERKRIAADLHDDLGAKLLTIVHTSESDRISTLAREALEEMRLSVRGLTGKPVQLLDALGDWRAEVVSRLAQANILAEWKSPAEDIEHTFPARAYVQTTRILRESVSNIIKHSGATHCVIGCSAQDGYFSVVIQDNGQGIPLELEGRLDKGHGMASMKARAKQMHGQCLVESGPGWGTVIRLTIPL
ncbi:ATP-binding protein [Mitsuaria sp. GD03876]|uniref:sensor histidine kinase n=1 Tax=Mitsuaria sp. GD03876 TaxID=2975399 RepID=UPI00244B6E70|nr:ATP-binding protein [Mitsuaria sp. GD03876]MDH0864753.1 ATP-binding protein [Mitsuaria sp. GD03876]